jgi:hypothetical protein
MDNITLGQIKDVVLFLVALIGGISSLYVLLMKGIKLQLQPIRDDLKDEKMKRLKSELTTFMYLAEQGNLSNEQKILAHEDYDEYIENKGNSYIHDRFEILKKEGKI